MRTQRIFCLPAFFLFLSVGYIFPQETHTVRLQLNSHESKYTFQWAVTNGKTLLLWETGTAEKRSAEFQFSGNIVDSIGSALRSMKAEDSIASFAEDIISPQTFIDSSSFSLMLNIDGSEYTNIVFTVKKDSAYSVARYADRMFKVLRDSTKPRDSAYFSISFAGKEKKGDGNFKKSLIAAGTVDSVIAVMARKLYESRNSIEKELTKRIDYLEAQVNKGIAVGYIQLRKSNVVPKSEHHGYWGMLGPYAKKYDDFDDNEDPIKKAAYSFFQGTWSYIMPYWEYVANVDETYLDTFSVQPAPFDILEAEISVKGGAFTQIIVRAKRGDERIDFYSDAPISVTTWENVYEFNNEKKYETILFGTDRSGEPMTIRANDILYYTIHPQNGSNYIPRDTVILLTKAQDAGQITLLKQNYMNYFDIRTYSDFSGLKKENPNGVLQFDLRYSFLLNSSETETFFEGYQSFIYPATIAALLIEQDKKEKNYLVPASILAGSVLFFSTQTPTSFLTKLEPFVTISRLEEKENLVISAFKRDSASTRTADSAGVKRFDLNRYANLKFGMDLEYMRARFPKINLFASMGVSAGILRTPIDSVMLDTSKLSGEQNLHSYFIMPYIQFEPINSEHVKFLTRYSLLTTKLIDQKIGNVDLSETVAGSFIHVLQTDFNLYTDLNDKSSWFFFRAVYYASKPYSDLSLQFGYSTSLSNVVKTGTGR